MTHNAKPILITGLHRSGSTWVGRMLAASSQVGYIHEPFNPTHDVGMCKARFEHWFTYVHPANEAKYYTDLRDMLYFRYGLIRGLKEARTLVEIWRRFIRAAAFANHRMARRRPLVKDPIAIFSVEWLAVRFDMDIVITIRHPAAFAESLKSRGWSHPFSHFLAQPQLMRDVLFPFEREICSFAEHERDILDQAALLWKMIYHTVNQYRQKHPEWIFVRHEDLSNDPVDEYARLYALLDLPFTGSVRRTIEEHSFRKVTGPEKKDYLPHDIHRNSRGLVLKWKNRLTADEINRIRSGVGEVSLGFYSEDEW
jgi:hypothetical protein